MTIVSRAFRTGWFNSMFQVQAGSRQHHRLRNKGTARFWYSTVRYLRTGRHLRVSTALASLLCRSSLLVCKTSLILVRCEHRYIWLPLLSENVWRPLSQFALFLLSAHCSFFRLRITNPRFDTLLWHSPAPNQILLTRIFDIDYTTERRTLYDFH